MIYLLKVTFLPHYPDFPLSCKLIYLPAVRGSSAGTSGLGKPEGRNRAFFHFRVINKNSPVTRLDEFQPGKTRYKM
jgi:hypothetical protein